MKLFELNCLSFVPSTALFTRPNISSIQLFNRFIHETKFFAIFGQFKLFFDPEAQDLLSISIKK